ncbi:MAG: PAS domain-containing sensor histidine kinase [Asticcacaulis sp.]
MARSAKTAKVSGSRQVQNSGRPGLSLSPNARIIALVLALGLVIFGSISGYHQHQQDVQREDPAVTAALSDLSQRASEINTRLLKAQTALQAGAESLARTSADPMSVAEIARTAADLDVVALSDASGTLIAVASATRAPSAPSLEALTAGSRVRTAKSLSLYPDPSHQDSVIFRVKARDGRWISTRIKIPLDKEQSLVNKNGTLLAATKAEWVGVRADALYGISADVLLQAARTGIPATPAPDLPVLHGTPVRVLSVGITGQDLLLLQAIPLDSPVTGTGLMLLWQAGWPLLVGLIFAGLFYLQHRRSAQQGQQYELNQERYRLAVEAARAGIWEWDLKEDLVYLSEVTGVMLGWGGAGVASTEDVLSRVAPEHRDRLHKAVLGSRTNGALDVSFRVPARTENGRSLWIDARGQAVGETDAYGFNRLIGVALDVTQERFAQSRAQTAETRLRDAIASISEAFVLWDRHDRMVMCNNTFREVFGLTDNMLKPGSPRKPIEHLANIAIKQKLPPQTGTGDVVEAELHDGRWLQISDRRTADGGHVVTGADITAVKMQEEVRRKNEEQLKAMVAQLELSQAKQTVLAQKYEAAKIRAEQANRAKSEFLANMSHELRTPLNAINGFSEIMSTEMFGPLGDKRYKEYSKDILSSGQHLLSLINDILDMSKIEAGKMTMRFEPVNLEDIVGDTLRLLRTRAEKSGLELKNNVTDMPDIEADFRSIKQVLLNLVSNAVKFTPAGGSVTVTATHKAGWVKIDVIDTGIGIADKDMERLAKPFEQIENQMSKTKEGTGLGLALTKSLIELHNGRLDIRSRLGVGTTVSVILPMVRPKLSAEADTESDEAAA